MRKPLISHSVLLAAFCALMVFMWMAPVMLAGFPYVFTSTIKMTHLGHLGVVNPLFQQVIRALLPVVDWRDAVSWAFVSAVTMALAIIPFWWGVRRLFGTSVAWTTVAVFAFMPMHWRLAVETGYYPLSLLCLMTGFALYVALAPRNRFAAAAAFGFCVGCTIATSHAFVTLLPWFIAVYAWEGRARWRRTLGALVVCGMSAYGAFLLSIVPSGVMLPIEENLLPAEEVYGDQYAYEFLREEFDRRMAERVAEGGFIEARDNEHFRINYASDSFSSVHVLLNGVWLFANASLAPLFMQETVGGVFLWLFIGLGISSLHRTQRRTLWMMIGLWLSMECIIRFGFHYGRIHLMNVGWIIAILAGSGIVVTAKALGDMRARIPHAIVVAAIAMIVVMQLAQANRSMFAGEYSRSRLPRAYAAAEAVKALPAHAVLAQPRDESLLIFTEYQPVVLQEQTIDVLAETGDIADPFRRYGITHVIGYDADHAALIRSAAAVEIVTVPDHHGVPLTPFVRFVLNLLR